MAGFRFRLESVLKQRVAQEEKCQRELAAVLRQRMIYENQIRGMQQTISDSKQEITGSLTGRIDLDRIKGFTRYSGEVTQRAHVFVIRLAHLEKEIVGTRKNLAEATRARRVIELLRDKQRREWLEAQNRREAAQLDEIALQQYNRLVAAEGRW